LGWSAGDAMKKQVKIRAQNCYPGIAPDGGLLACRADCKKLTYHGEIRRRAAIRPACTGDSLTPCAHRCTRLILGSLACPDGHARRFPRQARVSWQRLAVMPSHSEVGWCPNRFIHYNMPRTRSIACLSFHSSQVLFEVARNHLHNQLSPDWFDGNHTPRP
jgi:hypothetical protein